MISIVDSGSGQRSVIEDIGKLSTGTKTQIGSFKESVQATTRAKGTPDLSGDFKSAIENAELVKAKGAGDPFNRGPDEESSEAGGAKSKKEPYRLSGRTVLDFLDIEVDPKTNLAGNRWLTTDGSAFVIAPSGHGKSSLAMQLAICWAIGRIVFGIKPARPLRILIVQSEDDDADSKKFVQLIRKMGLSSEELALLRANTRFEFQRTISSVNGKELTEALDDWLTEWPADIAIINPLSGFLLCDLKNDPFLFHHTPKTNFTKLDNMQYYD